VAMEMVMIQSTAKLWKRGATDRLTDLTSRLLRYVVVLTTLLVAGVFVLSDQFLTLYFGPPYEASVTPLRLLLPGVFGFGVARVIWPVLQAGGHLRKLLAATGSAVVVNVVLNLLLIPRIGIVGAAISTSIAYGSMAVTHVLAARSVDLDPLDGLPIGRVFALGAVTVGVLVVLQPLGPWWVDLGVLPWIGLAVYAAGVFFFDVVTVEEIRDLVRSVV